MLTPSWKFAFLPKWNSNTLNAIVGEPCKSIAKSRASFQLRTSVTHSGLNVATVPTSKFHQAYIAEHFFKLAGTFLLPAGGLALILPMIFMPYVVSETMFWTSELGVVAAFVCVGIALHRWADRGFLRKVQIDATKQEIRIGTVNIDGTFHLRSTHPVASIESFFIIRSRNPGEPARLKIRSKNTAHTVDVVVGTEHSLIQILEQITLTLKPPKMRNRRIRTQTTGGFIRMSFN